MQFEIFRELIEVMMAQQFTCLGHKEREDRRNKINQQSGNKLCEDPRQELQGLGQEGSSECGDEPQGAGGGL